VPIEAHADPGGDERAVEIGGICAGRRHDAQLAVALAHVLDVASLRQERRRGQGSFRDVRRLREFEGDKR